MSRKKNKGRICPPSLLSDSQNVTLAKPRHISKMAISFEYVPRNRRFCLSKCSREEIKGIVGCLQDLTKRTWVQVYSTGGRSGGGKTGLGWTFYKDKDIRGVSRPAHLTPDVRIAGIRFGQKGRIYGYHLDGIFFLLWFDPGHKIVEV